MFKLIYSFWALQFDSGFCVPMLSSCQSLALNKHFQKIRPCLVCWWAQNPTNSLFRVFLYLSMWETVAWMVGLFFGGPQVNYQYIISGPKKVGILSNLYPPRFFWEGCVILFWKGKVESKKLFGAEFWFLAHCPRKWLGWLAATNIFGISTFMLPLTSVEAKYPEQA